jgi:hypothetical protein
MTELTKSPAPTETRPPLLLSSRATLLALVFALLIAAFLTRHIDLAYSHCTSYLAATVGALYVLFHKSPMPPTPYLALFGATLAMAAEYLALLASY